MNVDLEQLFAIRIGNVNGACQARIKAVDGALDFERLFFLLIILPIVVIFFAIFGLLGWWVERRTRHPLPGTVMAGFAFAWALGVTFPMLSAG